MNICGVFLIALLIIAPFFLPIPAFAENAKTCDFKDLLVSRAKLEKNPSLADDDRTTRALDVDKQLLSLTVQCSQDELRDLQATLRTEFATGGKDASSLLRLLDSDIQGAFAHYENILSEISSLDPVGIRNSAHDLKVWRAQELTPLIERVQSALLWAMNDTLLRKTEDRLRQIRQTVRSFQVINSDVVQTIFEKASAQFMRAQEEHVRSRQAIERGYLPEESLSHIKQTLDFLSQTYQSFFELSGAIQKLLPRS